MEPREKFEISEMEKFLEEHELHTIHYDVLERIITLVIAALGLIAALAWDDALRHIFEKLFGSEGSSLGEIAYAVVVTVIAAFISVRLGKRFLRRKKK